MNRRNCMSMSVATALLAATGLSLTPALHAQNPADADAMYDGFLKAYLTTVDSNNALCKSHTQVEMTLYGP